MLHDESFLLHYFLLFQSTVNIVFNEQGAVSVYWDDIPIKRIGQMPCPSETYIPKDLVHSFFVDLFCFS